MKVVHDDGGDDDDERREWKSCRETKEDEVVDLRELDVSLLTSHDELATTNHLSPRLHHTDVVDQREMEAQVKRQTQSRVDVSRPSISLPRA